MVLWCGIVSLYIFSPSRYRKEIGIMMQREELLQKINALLDLCDLPLLDFILQLLQKLI